MPSSTSSTLRKKTEGQNKLTTKTDSQTPIYDSITTKPQSIQQAIVSSSNNIHSSFEKGQDSSSFHMSTLPSTKRFPQQNNFIDFQQKINGTKRLDEHRESLEIETAVQLSNSSISNQLFMTNGNSNSGIYLPPIKRHTTSTLTKDRNLQNNNRNHILTDSLPGPESCV